MAVSSQSLWSAISSPWYLMLLGSHWSLLVLSIGVEGVSMAGSSDFSWWWMIISCLRTEGTFQAWMLVLVGPSYAFYCFWLWRRNLRFTGTKRFSGWLSTSSCLFPSIYLFVFQQKRNPQPGVDGRRGCSLGHSLWQVSQLSLFLIGISLPIIVRGTHIPSRRGMSLLSHLLFPVRDWDTPDLDNLLTLGGGVQDSLLLCYSSILEPKTTSLSSLIHSVLFPEIVVVLIK